MVLYINGIAVAMIELKRSSIEVADGVRQLITNQEEIFNKQFFPAMQFLFAGSDSQGLRYGTTGTPEQFFVQWKDEEGDSAMEPGTLLDKPLAQMCRKERLLDLIRNFIIFDAGQKKVPRPHQYFGIKAAQERVSKREGGVIWHTQRSGKSILMVLLAKWLMEHDPDARVLIITDRDELDKQIVGVMRNAGVIIPGLTSASIPRSPNATLARGIAPPDGLIAGASGTGIDATKEALVEEQECLFFVALSCARDRLFLYHPTVRSDGANRPRSPFIGRLGFTIKSRPVVPLLTPPPADGELPVPITISGTFAFNDYQLALYERCPRRFLYTHVLEIGGRRTESAFMKLHGAVQRVVDGLSQQLDTLPPLTEIETQLANEWDSHGPADHGYSDEYKRIAWQLIRFYMDSSSGSKRLPAPQMRLPVTGGEIVVTPNQVLTDDAGNVRMRRVRTGHKKSNDDDSLAAAAFHIAESTHSPGCTVELVFLSDNAVTPIEMTARLLGNRRNSIAEMAANVKGGLFPLKERPTCPRCPAYYVCPSLPAGKLNKNFSA